MKQIFDLIVIGAGNAGLLASAIAKKAGRSVAIIEEGKIGGTCPLRGCVPKKVLVVAAEVIDEINHASAHHIQVGKPILNWARLIQRKNQIIKPLSSSAEKSLKSNGIEIIRGRAQFVDRQTVKVNDTTYNAKKIVIATGSIPRVLPFPGGQYVISSDELLNLKELPQSLVFIGSGVIGFEFSHILARAGVKITLLELASQVLPQKDKDVVKILISKSERLGIKIVTKVKIKTIEKKNSAFVVTFLHNGQGKIIKTELVANGAGRVPNINNLNLEAGDVEYEGNYILHDKFLRSRSNSNVFVAGDPVDSPQLSPLSTYEGKIVGHNLTNKKMITPDYSCIPSCIFTIPALSSVGLTEEEANQKGLKFTIKAHDLTNWISALTYAEQAAFSKILIEKETNRILGAHILGHGGQELINLFAFAMKHGITAEQIRETVFSYPTFSSDIPSML